MLIKMVAMVAPAMEQVETAAEKVLMEAQVRKIPTAAHQLSPVNGC